MICIIGSETTKSYGLFNDLNGNEQIKILYTEKRNIFQSFWVRMLRKLGFKNIKVHKQVMSWEQLILNEIEKYQEIIVIDTALRRLDLSFLNQCKKNNPKLRIDCMLLNSELSITMSEYNIKHKFNEFPWHKILTFDPVDAVRNKWQYIGFNYYSVHRIPAPKEINNCAFYAGTIVGERGNRVFQLLKYFNDNNISCEFICPKLSNFKLGRGRIKSIPKGLKLIRKRIPYNQILSHTVKNNCIIEILQKGQAGPSLRYFEAICYNKKLLTTNQMIRQFPFYDERYMKVFQNVDDIDLEWIKRVENIDYGYSDEFSPKYLNL